MMVTAQQGSKMEIMTQDSQDRWYKKIHFLDIYSFWGFMFGMQLPRFQKAIADCRETHMKKPM